MVPKAVGAWIGVTVFVILIIMILANVSENTKPPPSGTPGWTYPSSSVVTFLNPPPPTLHTDPPWYPNGAYQRWYAVTEYDGWQFCEGDQAYAPATLYNNTAKNPYLAIWAPYGGTYNITYAGQPLVRTESDINREAFYMMHDACSPAYIAAAYANNETRKAQTCEWINDRTPTGLPPAWSSYKEAGRSLGWGFGTISTVGNPQYTLPNSYVDAGFITNVANFTADGGAIAEYDPERLRVNNAYCATGTFGHPSDAHVEAHAELDMQIRAAITLLAIIPVILALILVMKYAGYL